MSLKVKQHGLFNTQSINALKIKQRMSFIKYAALFISLLFSLNSFAVGDLFSCNNSTWERYNKLHRMIKERPDIIKDIDLVYNLAVVSLCLGEEVEGIAHLQKASNFRHIPATLLLGDYYRHNQTFDSSELTNNLEDLNKALYYYKRGIQMIEALPNYPDGSTDDMEYIEYASPVSFYLFTGLSFLYFRGYAIAFKNIINGNKEETFYNDTLEVLNKISKAARHCLNRPALDVWKEKRETVYEAQQIKCSAFLEFAEKAYHLEQQRIEADQNCQSPLKECTEHQEVVDKIYQLAGDMFDQIRTAPEI